MARTIFEKADVVPLVAEVFRELGYEGASMSSITARTKLSKGSIYHFFPGGKEAMAGEILAHVDAWFVRHVFEPLEHDEPRAAIASMWKSVDVYFRSGRRICLVGAFALDEARDIFAGQIRQYFKRWIEALSGALARGGMDPRWQRSSRKSAWVVFREDLHLLARSMTTRFSGAHWSGCRRVPMPVSGLSSLEGGHRRGA